MANFRLAYRNFIDDAWASTTVTSEASGFEKIYLSDPWLSPSYTWRSTSTANQSVGFDLGIDRSISCFALWNHNLSATAQIRVQGSDSSSYSTTVYNALYVNQAVQPTNALMGGLPAGEMPFWVKFVTPTTFARYWRFILYDSGNPDGYLSVGRAWFGLDWSPGANMDWGYRMGWEDPSQYQRSIGGQILVKPRALYRVANITLSHLTDTESTELQDIKAYYALQRDAILSAYPGEGTVRERQNTIIGRVVDYSANNHARFGQTSASFTFEEGL